MGIAIFLSSKNSLPIVATYNMSLGESYTIRASDKGSVAISVHYDNIDRIEILVSGENLSDFRREIIKLREKYIEWKTVAVANNVKNHYKQFPDILSTTYVMILWEESGKTYAALPTVITPVFLVTEEGECGATIGIPSLVSATTKKDESVSLSAGAIILFSSEDEIQSLIDALDPIHIKNYYEANPPVDDLFK